MGRRKWLDLGAAIVLGVAVAGCSHASAGSPVADADAGSSSSDSHPSGGMNGVDPCELIDPATMTDLGFNAEGQHSKRLGNTVCDWQSPKNDDGLKLGQVGLAVSDSLGIDQLHATGAKSSKLSVGGRDAKQLAVVGGECDLGIAVGPHGRAVLIVKLITGSTDKACDIARTLGEDVAHNLPNGK